MNKILCTGNPDVEGIPKALKELYPDTVFISRSSGADFNTEEGINKVIELAKQSNVFVNCIQPQQNKLFDIISNLWTEGSIFNIGTVLEFDKWRHLDPKTADEKLALREASLNACTAKLKTTHVVVSGFRDRINSDPSRMDPIKIAETIQWILNNDIHIPLITVAKVEC
jgi:hypothetical protein